MIQGETSHEVLQIETIGPFQIILLIVGVLVLLADGFDAQMVGYVAPAISVAWQVPTASFAPVFAANVFGLMIGALAITTVADMIGRKWIICLCVGVFGITSLMVTAVHGIQQLVIIRFVSGVALGGAMPCMIAATSDYFPAKYRTRLGMIMSASWSIGIAICGLVTGLIVESRGWQSLFVIGGAVPLLLLPLLLIYLPESPTYLAKKGRLDELNKLLKRIHPRLVYQPHPIAPKRQFPLATLFEGALSKITPLVWAAYFCAGVAIYFFLNWLPIFVKDAGYAPSEAAFVSSAYQIGALIGGFAVSYAVDRWGAIGLTVSLIAASIAVAMVGVSTHSMQTLAIAVSIAGFMVVGSQNTANAYVGGSLYPSEIRATGLGWALGSVRLSGVLAGALGVGVLLSMNLGPATTLIIIGIPEIFAGLAFLGVHRLKRARA